MASSRVSSFVFCWEMALLPNKEKDMMKDKINMVDIPDILKVGFILLFSILPSLNILISFF